MGFSSKYNMPWKKPEFNFRWLPEDAPRRPEAMKNAVIAQKRCEK
jgi:hypothetical protein